MSLRPLVGSKAVVGRSPEALSSPNRGCACENPASRQFNLGGLTSQHRRPQRFVRVEVL